MSSLCSIYSHPAYYEIGFCTPSIKKEAAFVSRCFRKHGSRAVVPSVLDNGCGTGLHLEVFAKQGCRIGGYDAVQEMVEYTCARLARITKGHEVFQGDLREFATQRKYDIAICMNGSFQHLFTTEDVLSHLECVAKALKKNGLYLVSLPPPEDFLLNPPGQAKSKWAKNRGASRLLWTGPTNSNPLTGTPRPSRDWPESKSTTTVSRGPSSCAIGIACSSCRRSSRLPECPDASRSPLSTLTSIWGESMGKPAGRER